jgi:hypothetical protein
VIGKKNGIKKAFYDFIHYLFFSIFFFAEVNYFGIFFIFLRIEAIFLIFSIYGLALIITKRAYLMIVLSD